MSHKNGLISVIIPVYNVEPYLRQCLDSVINQTYRDLEIILIDDGSPDNCGAICDEYAQKDDRIVVIHKQNGGVSMARNDGIERATGEWVTFVDSDDWCDADFYERLLEAMPDQNIDILCSGGWIREYGNYKRENCIFYSNILYEGKAQTDFLMAKTLNGKCGNPKNKRSTDIAPSWGKLYRRSFLLQNYLRFDKTLHPYEDNLFNFLAFDKADCAAVCGCIGYHYQMTPTAVTNSFNPRMPNMCVSFLNSLNFYYENRKPNNLIQNAINAKPIIEFTFLARLCYFHKDNPKPYRVIAAEIKKLKLEPAFNNAIYSNSNQYLSKKHIVLKYMLRLPWVWPVKLYYDIKRLLHR